MTFARALTRLTRILGRNRAMPKATPRHDIDGAAAAYIDFLLSGSLSYVLNKDLCYGRRYFLPASSNFVGIHTYNIRNCMVDKESH